MAGSRTPGGKRGKNNDCIDCIPLGEALKLVLEKDNEVKVAYQVRIMAVQLYKASLNISPKSITWGPDDLPFFILRTNHVFLDHANGVAPIDLAALEDLYYATLGKIKDLLAGVELRVQNAFSAASDTYLEFSNAALALSGPITAQDFRGSLRTQKSLMTSDAIIVTVESALRRKVAQKQHCNPEASFMPLAWGNPHIGLHASSWLETRPLTTDMLWPYGTPNVRLAAKLPPAIIFGTLREKYRSESYRVPRDGTTTMGTTGNHIRENEGEALLHLIQAAVRLRGDSVRYTDTTDTCNGSSTKVSHVDPTLGDDGAHNIRQCADADDQTCSEDIVTAQLKPLPDRAPYRRSCCEVDGHPSYIHPKEDIGVSTRSPSKGGVPDRPFRATRGYPVDCRIEAVIWTGTALPWQDHVSEAAVSPQRPNLKRNRLDQDRRLHRNAKLYKLGRYRPAVKPPGHGPSGTWRIDRQQAADCALIVGRSVEEVIATLEWLRVHNADQEDRGRLYHFKSSANLLLERSIKGGPGYVVRAGLRRLLRLQPAML
ncbi:MAG: hypothetical protein Q9181_000625 [Wetmoreana brouardii]